MHIKDKVCVVTGGASGIGEAVARAYAAAGARGVVVADLKTSRDKLASVAGDIEGLAVTADVGEEQDIKALIAAAEAKFGPVDIFFSNAGLSRKGQESASDADWDVSWRVHVMSHVFAARALVPGMLARGSGYLLNTASAAGLLASLNSMPYGVTKSAAVALAEHLAIQYGDRGIRVSVLCPQSVQTGMTTAGPSAARVDGVLQPSEVARMVIARPQAATAGSPECGGCATGFTGRSTRGETEPVAANRISATRANCGRDRGSVITATPVRSLPPCGPLAGEGRGGGSGIGTARVDPHPRPLRASFARLDPARGRGEGRTRRQSIQSKPQRFRRAWLRVFCSTPRTRRESPPSPRGHCARSAPARGTNDRRPRRDGATPVRRAPRRQA